MTDCNETVLISYQFSAISHYSYLFILNPNNMNISANGILKVCLGISAIVLSVTAFNFSIQPANAAPAQQEVVEETTSKIGKYQMSLCAVPVGDQINWSVIVWDTETGTNETYYDKGSSSFGPSFNISKSSSAGY
jgi:hypothetical protein